MALDARPAAGLPSGDGLAVPRIPVSAGAMVFDRSGRLLILKPTYKSGWTIPGGVMEADGETPWQACRREVLEECGIDVRAGRLACTDFRPARPDRPERAHPCYWPLSGDPNGTVPSRPSIMPAASPLLPATSGKLTQNTVPSPAGLSRSVTRPR